MQHSVNSFLSFIVVIACLFNANVKAAGFFKSDVVLTHKKTGTKLGKFMGKCSVSLESSNHLKITCSGSQKSDVTHYLIYGATELSYEIESGTTNFDNIGQSSAIHSNAMISLRDTRTIFIYFHIFSSEN